MLIPLTLALWFVGTYNKRMIEKLHYSTGEDGQVRIDVPKDVIHDVLGRRGALYEACRDRAGYVTARGVGEGDYRVVLDLSHMSRMRTQVGEQQVKRAVGGLSELEDGARAHEASDEWLSMEIATSSVGYGHYFTDAEFRRVRYNDQWASTLGTRAMQRAARAIRSGPTDDIGVNYETSRGVSFVAGGIISSSIETDGNEYQADSATVEVKGHNLYSPGLQLICISGIIAVATAERQEWITE